MKPSPTVANLALVLLCLIWGSTWLVIRTGLEDLPPLHGAAIRFTVASLVFSLAAIPLRRMEGGPAPAGWLSAMLGTLNFALSYGIVYWAETVLPSALASILWAVFPMMMAVAGHLFLPGEKLAGRHWIGFALGFVGVGLLFETDLRDLSSMHENALWVGGVYLLSPLVSAVGQTCIKRYGEGASSVLLNRNGMLLGAALLWIAALTLERGAELRFTSTAVWSVLYLSVMGTCVTFGLYYWLLRFQPAYKMSLIAYVTPAIAILLGWAVADEPITRFTLAGTGLVLVGVGLVRR
ncbi:MAG: EamA family transporter [Planctomycetota bacterium]